MRKYTVERKKPEGKKKAGGRRNEKMSEPGFAGLWDSHDGKKHGYLVIKRIVVQTSPTFRIHVHPADEAETSKP